MTKTAELEKSVISSQASSSGILCTTQQPALSFLAIGLMGLGVLALRYGDFALVWQPVPTWIPGRTALAYASGILMLTCGVGLLFRKTAALASTILLPYLVLWVLLKVPALFVAPQIEAVWLGIGELIVLLTGGWFLFARLAPGNSPFRFLASERVMRIAILLFGICLIPIGMSHLFYPKETLELVPAWMPVRIAWVYITGVGQIACGLGVLFSVLPKLAAMAEAGMISLFTLLVWMPAIFAAPTKRLPWTAFFISWIIAAGAWAVAQNIPQERK